MQQSVPVSAMALQTFHTEFDGAEASLAARLVDDEPWFRGAEGATALGCKRPQNAVHTHVDEEDKTTMQNLRVPDSGTLTNGNEGAAVYISESGLYALIMRSKLPAAKLFKRWVLKVVLPTIRRAGSYTATRSASPQLTDAQQWEARRGPACTRPRRVVVALRYPAARAICAWTWAYAP